jgi:hypothetical protein
MTMIPSGPTPSWDDIARFIDQSPPETLAGTVTTVAALCLAQPDLPVLAADQIGQAYQEFHTLGDEIVADLRSGDPKNPGGVSADQIGIADQLSRIMEVRRCPRRYASVDRSFVRTCSSTRMIATL